MANPLQMTATEPAPQPELVYVDPKQPDWSRKRWGRGFIFLDGCHERISDPDILQRLRSMPIPHPWDQVWVCSRPNGHIQACGYDERHRKQYLYHVAWTRLQQIAKFDRIREFAQDLPRLRKAVGNALQMKGWPREKVTALAIQLMDQHYLRVGNREYQIENGTFGATTLRRRHVMETAEGLHLRYRAKSGKERTIRLHDRRLQALIRDCSELPGYELFRYQDADQSYKRLESQDVNDFIREVTGADYTAKQFRTFGGTVTALRAFFPALSSLRQQPRRKLETEIVRRVADTLGNTQAVCRRYYIHPAVLALLADCAHDPDPATRLEKSLQAYMSAKDRSFPLPDRLAVLEADRRGGLDPAEQMVARFLEANPEVPL